MNIKDDFILKNINKGYLVGGSVRDFFMGKPFCDRDIAIKNAEPFAKKISEQFNGTFITLDSENKIFRVVLEDKINYLDISELCGETIEEDLMRRDFTINAIAYDLEKEEFIDILGGMEDIKNKKLVSIKEENFIDDPLRILRAFRFMATTGFEIDEELINIIKKHMTLIKNPAKERIHDELMKLFGGGKYNNTSKTLLKMYEIGILELLFPQVKEMASIPSNSHHHLDLIHHVIETVRQIEIFFNEADDEIREHLLRTDFGGYPRINHLKLAGFLHDIGKYSVWSVETDEGLIPIIGNPNAQDLLNKNLRQRFIKHDLLGAEIVIPLLKNLKFSNKQIGYISNMIRNHIYPSGVISSPSLDNKVMLRYIRKMEDNVIDNIILAKADRLSAQGPEVTKEITEANLNGLQKLLEYYLEIRNTLKPLPKLLDGNEIMELLKLKPSKELGNILNRLKEAQLNQEVNSKEEAINFVLNLKKKPDFHQAFR